MARIGQLFGGRTRDAADVEPRHDRDRDGVDDRLESTTVRRVDRDRDGVDDRLESTDRTSRIPAVGVLDRDTDRDGIADSRETTTTTLRRSIDREAPPAPVSPPPPPVAEVRPAPARASMTAALGLILGVAGVAVALTGLLAPWAIAVGALGLLFSFGGIVAGARPGVAGRGLGSLGVLVNGTAIVFAILAMTGQVSWLDSNVDQVARLNEWLDARLPWMKDW
ncbi:hypothetical protein GCM10010399_60610 [Dactylosporangium fulvum]|uniref:Integral membrane protein n=1 Tax=Dactylosporangium fulvum TaxID=53359 RepID=A0ABY5W3Q6_9ACTN|nr:hypothetical protein [Dactylosporangium fulvum]UWP84595.1 hypothetical protein Dfulv_10320 [Dactylosporangium fulvum]